MGITVEERRRTLYLRVMRRKLKSGRGSSEQFYRMRGAVRVPSLASLVGHPYVVVGGTATSMYMPERVTKDIDILVRAHDYHGVEQALAAGGATSLDLLHIPGTLGLVGRSWRLPDGSELDVLTSPRAWVSRAVENPTHAPAGTPIISLPYLVLMKLDASRAIDLGDIERMIGLAPPDARAAARRMIARHLPGSVEDFDGLAELAALSVGREAASPSPPPGPDRPGGRGGDIVVREHLRRGKTVREHTRHRPS